jgi:hypothetical protein
MDKIQNTKPTLLPGKPIRYGPPTPTSRFKRVILIFRRHTRRYILGLIRSVKRMFLLPAQAKPSKPITPGKGQCPVAVELVAVDVGVDGLQPFKA